MRDTPIPSKEITGVTIQQDPTGYHVSWRSRDGKYQGRATGQTLAKAQAAAVRQAQEAGYTLVP